MKKMILMMVLAFSISVASISCRETPKEVKVETEESKGAIERAGEKVDNKVNKEIDKAIDKIGDDN